MPCWLFKNQIMLLSKFTWLGNNKIMSFVADMIRYGCVLTVYRKYTTESQGHTSGNRALNAQTWCSLCIY